MTILIGVSGDAGSFSEQAGLLYIEKNFPNTDIKPSLSYLTDMENVLSAVEIHKVDIGIFPIINFRGGLVHMAFEAMGKHLFKMIDEVWLDVHQCLLIQPNVRRDQIKKIVSHPQAIAQCKNYLKKYFSTAEFIHWQDTAKAAKDLSQGVLSSDTAVIAPMVSASLYHLEIFAENIEDTHPNITVFIVVKPIEEDKP